MAQRPENPDLSAQASPPTRFQDLMRNRVHHILLVSSLYDSFILAEDGQLNQALLDQFLELNLTQNPDLTRISTGSEALALAAGTRRFDLIIATPQVGDMDAVELARKLRDQGSRIPVVVIAYSNRELVELKAREDVRVLDRIFLWQGDVRILLAIVKYVEDQLNVDHDTGIGGVPAIIVVEDNVRFYSAFLPVIYTELVRHTQSLVTEGVNLAQKLLRMRARPKVLLCESYEEAWSCFSRFQDHILGIISDIQFPWGGTPHPQAGVELAARVREVRFDIPMMLQSSRPENEELAERIGASFLLKGSPTLLNDLRTFMCDQFGFEDFVFRLPDGSEIDRAPDLRSLVAKLETTPAESLGYHGERNHFSIWLKARGEYALAHRLRPRKVSDFASLEDLRRDMIRSLSKYRRQRDRMIVADFDRNDIDPGIGIARIGSGSLGGKARGLAFVNRLLSESMVSDDFPGLEIAVPSCVVLGTDIFDQFLAQNALHDLAMGSASDAEIERRFLAATFPAEVVLDLKAFLEDTDCPLAVRSSGLLEDSPEQPFAGVYETYMLPNNHSDIGVRLARLIAAVKRVYASTFSQQSKGFVQMTAYRLEEEKMAVIIQRMVGVAHGDRFYPHFSGVARSHNFYPLPPLETKDGVASVALGLGKTVVEGGTCLTFCPSYPRHLVAFSSTQDVLKNSQREFFALKLHHGTEIEETAEGELVGYGLEVAEGDGVLSLLGSSYDRNNHAISDGISRPGVRLVSFAGILKHEAFPLARLLERLLKLGSEGTSTEVEIEFAVNLRGADGGKPEFGFLQMRPLALSRELEELEIGDEALEDIVCRSSRVLGNGRICDLHDLVVVDHYEFDRSRSREVALQVGRFDAQLQSEQIPYVLVGVGRWGSTDPFLGIPVTWNQIAGARVIVEAGLKDIRVEPSQGSHFFQNITTCHIGYFTVNAESGDGEIDWQWLAEQPALGAKGAVRHIRLENPITVKMNGRTGEGVILKSSRPGDEPAK